MTDSPNIREETSPERRALLLALPMSLRASRVLEVILETGFVTTEQIHDMGYDHPPRAVRDLIDAGVGINKHMTVGNNGKRMARYVLSGAIEEGSRGRRTLSKAFSDRVKSADGYRCAICSGIFPGREIQVDHRVPFAIAGEDAELREQDFMPLCASDNRAKSWSCEHCANWIERSVETCLQCFWCSPTSYTHVAKSEERRIDLVFQGDREVAVYDDLVARATEAHVTIGDYISGIFHQKLF